MPGFCMRRAAARARFNVHSPLKQYKKDASFIRAEESEISHEINDLPESGSDNRIMVVIDSSHEAKGALEWALSHAVQSQDTVILLHVARKDGKANEEINRRAYDLLQSTKNTCRFRIPGVHVEIAMREGKEKGAVIVEAAKQLRASLLVLGQPKKSLLWPLRIWMRKGIPGRVVDYCIQNASCMTIAVRMKNKKHGGYMITTKRHKNFWLLA